MVTGGVYCGMHYPSLFPYNINFGHSLEPVQLGWSKQYPRYTFRAKIQKALKKLKKMLKVWQKKKIKHGIWQIPLAMKDQQRVHNDQTHKYKKTQTAGYETSGYGLTVINFSISMVSTRMVGPITLISLFLPYPKLFWNCFGYRQAFNQMS